ncbi:MAG: tetratricopeptide repeat protein [Pseudomonadota bacterium]|nr:tetratricopeptide repeat protein [Pseudomonadota bacterium]
MKLFEELKRRNVFRMAAVYLAVSWLLTQVSASLENALALPGWFDALVIALLAIGFAPAILFSWAFEITPDGVKKTAEIDADASIATQTGRKLDYVLIGVLLLAILVVVADRLAPARREAPAVAGAGEQTPAAPLPAAGANSIAVLPFADMSAGGDQEYFADGISEELLNLLAGVRGLQVAGRTSSFAFRDQNRDLRDIGEALGVAHLLEGSVRKSGERVRITAQLVRADNGFHVWSNTYDRDLTDIFAVQDEIAGSIVSELKMYLPGAAADAPAPSTRASVGAYDLYLLARDRISESGKQPYIEAIALLDQAIALEPAYAPALAWRAYARLSLTDLHGSVGDLSFDEVRDDVKRDLDRALEADPKSAEALLSLSNFYALESDYKGDGDYARAIEALKKTIEIRPSFPQALNDLGFYYFYSGRLEEADETLAAALELDPNLFDANINYNVLMRSLGRFAEAERAAGRWLRISPDNEAAKAGYAIVMADQGRLADAAIRMRDVDYRKDPSGIAGHAALLLAKALGDTEKFHTLVVEAAYTPHRTPAHVAALEGDLDRAASLARADSRGIATSWRGLVAYIPFLFYAGDERSILDYYAERFAEDDALKAALNACLCSPAALAATLNAAGHPDAARVMSIWREWADENRTLYARSPMFAANEGDRLALAGDVAGAVREYSRAMDLGWRSPFFANRRYLRYLPDDPAYDAQIARMKSLIDGERARLGMAPLK